MHNFKRLAASVISISLLFVLISGIIITPFLNSEHAYFQDGKLRSSLAGQIDLVTIGASNSLNAYNPQILDAELGCFSYNLSESMMKLSDRLYFLEREIQRNPIKTVILDLSYDTLARNEDNEYAVGEEVSFGRIESFQERFYYLSHYVKLDDWLNLYSREFVSSLEFWSKKLTGQSICNVDYSAKGFSPKKASDMSLSDKDITEQYNSITFSANFREENITKLRELIQFCQSKNIRVIVAVTPVPWSVIWRTDHLDEFLNWVVAFCQEMQCEFYDMNLLKNRWELFDDHTAFSDVTHMSSRGADTYSKEFSRIIQKTVTDDISQDFYHSYKEMKQVFQKEST